MVQEMTKYAHASFCLGNRTVFHSAPVSGTRQIRSQKLAPEKWSRFSAPISGVCVMGTTYGAILYVQNWHKVHTLRSNFKSQIIVAVPY